MGVFGYPTHGRACTIIPHAGHILPSCLEVLHSLLWSQGTEDHKGERD